MLMSLGKTNIHNKGNQQSINLRYKDIYNISKGHRIKNKSWNNCWLSRNLQNREVIQWLKGSLLQAEVGIQEKRRHHPHLVLVSSAVM